MQHQTLPKYLRINFSLPTERHVLKIDEGNFIIVLACLIVILYVIVHSVVNFELHFIIILAYVYLVILFFFFNYFARAPRMI